MEFFWFNSRYRFYSSPSDLGVRMHRSKLAVPTAERPVHSCPKTFQQPPEKKSFQILVHLPFCARIQLSQLKCLHPGFKMVRSLHLKNFPVLLFVFMTSSDRGHSPMVAGSSKKMLQSRASWESSCAGEAGTDHQQTICFAFLAHLKARQWDR